MRKLLTVAFGFGFVFFALVFCKRIVGINEAADAAEKLRKLLADADLDADAKETESDSDADSAADATLKNNCEEILSHYYECPIAVNFDELPEDVVAFMAVEDKPELFFPVMQGKGNQFYLSHNYLGEEDHNGSVYLSELCNIDDPHAVIYGHNMTSTKAMFFHLYDVEVGDVMWLLIRDGNPRRFECMSVFDTDKHDDILKIGYGPEDLQAIADYSRTKAGLDSIHTGDQILVTSTCNRNAGYGADGRREVVWMLSN